MILLTGDSSIGAPSAEAAAAVAEFTDLAQEISPSALTADPLVGVLVAPTKHGRAVPLSANNAAVQNQAAVAGETPTRVFSPASRSTVVGATKFPMMDKASLIATVGFTDGSANVDGGSAAAPQVASQYGQLPFGFEANLGQFDSQVDFVARSPGYTTFLTPTEAVFRIQESSNGSDLKETVTGAAVRMQIVGGQEAPRVEGQQKLPGISNYFVGNDPNNWHTNVSSYARVEYSGVYPGIDLVYYGTSDQQLEYDFVVAPGANPNTITLNFAGAETIETNPSGDLILHTAAGEIIQPKPYIYQDINGVRRTVNGSYALSTPHSAFGTHQVRFDIDAYDTSRPLVIDPIVMSYSTYLGGGGNDSQRLGIAVDSAGSAYVAGPTASTNFPTTSGAFDTTFNGVSDAFVAKLNATGTALVYATYVGGSSDDQAYGVAVDSSGSAYITGTTSSTNFPTTAGAFDLALNGGDAFVTKLNPSGTALSYSTYLGGSSAELGYGIAVDSSNNAYVTGRTTSTNLPTQTPFQAAHGGGAYDAFVTKLNAAGSALAYSTYLGGSSSTDYGYSIVVDGSNSAYVAGYTQSNNFPTQNPFQAARSGGFDAFVTKLAASGSTLDYSTYLGGTLNDFGYGIAVDSNGNAYVTGETNSTNFPTQSPFQATNAGGQDAFVTKFTTAGTALTYSTYLGGSSLDSGRSIAVNSAGSAYVTGETGSTNFPTQSAIQSTNAGAQDAFVTQLSVAGAALVYSSFVGGTSNGDAGHGIALDTAGSIYLTGATNSSDFPATPSAFDTSYNGSFDAFVMKLVSSDPATHLQVAAPAGAVAGAAVNITVTALSDNDTTDLNYQGTVHFTSTDGQAVLPADYTFTPADQGVHTFSVTLKTAGSRNVTVTDTVTGTITGSDTVQVDPAAASTLTLASFPSPTTAGVQGSFTVTALDPYGNTATGYSGTVTFNSSDGQAALPADSTLIGGVGSFDATLKSAGTQSLTATDTVTATITGSQAGIIVEAAAAATLNVAGFPSPTTAGDQHSITVTARDAFGNTATGYTGAVNVTSSDTQATLPGNYSFIPADAGVKSLPVTLKTVGTQSITATDTVTGTITGTQSGIGVNPSAGATYVVTGHPSVSTAGDQHPFTVTVRDQFGNTATGYTGTVTFASSDGQASLPSDYTFTLADAGVRNFDVTLKTAGPQTIIATDTVIGTITGSQSGITVNSAAAVTFIVSGHPSASTAGDQHTFTVTARDAFGNTATGYTGTVTFASSDGQANLPGDYTFTPSDAGIRNFAVTLKTAATQSITATDTVTGTITGSQIGIAVNPAAAASFIVSGHPSTSTAGDQHTFTVTARDAYGNTATGYTGTVTFASSDGQATLPSDYTFTLADAGVKNFAVTLKTAATQSITATDTVTGTITGTQSGITVHPAAAASLQVSGFPSSATAGDQHSFTVTARDAYGNIATGYSGTVTFSSNDPQAVLPADSTLTGGTGAFPATLKTAGSRSITATDTVSGSITGTQSGILVIAAAAAVFDLTTTATWTIPGKPVLVALTAYDAYQNVATGYTGTVHFTSSDTNAILPLDYTFVTGDQGVHTFSVKLYSSGIQSITVTDTVNGALTDSVTVSVKVPTSVPVIGFPRP
jgi:hypothetical protein